MDTIFKPTLRFLTLLFLTIAVLGGCATQIVETPAVMQVPSVRLGTFDKVIFAEAEMSPLYAEHAANQKAARKINSVIYSGLNNIFGPAKMKKVQKADEAKTESGTNTLIVKPIIKQIKFVNATARVWAGAMAGSSVVIMDVHYIDAKTGEQIGIAGFQKVAGAYEGAFGIADNRMLSAVADDVVMFTRSNF